MSYCSENSFPLGTTLKRVLEVIELLGYRKYEKREPSSPLTRNLVKSYYWYEPNEYKSWAAITLEIYKERNQITVHTRTTISRSYWDLTHQNKTIKLLRDTFGGCFTTDEGRNRYMRPKDPPPSPLSSGSYLARWRFRNSLQLAHIYLMARQLESNMAREEPTGISYLDELNPRLLSNNLLIPYVIGVWEEYFRATFIAALRYGDKRETVLKKAKLSHSQLEKIASKTQLAEQTIAECFSFQYPSVICENFKMLDSQLDLASVLRKPYRGRKTNLYESIEKLVTGRNTFVHTGQMDMSLYDKELKRTLNDLVEAVNRCYNAIGLHFKFDPIHSY